MGLFFFSVAWVLEPVGCLCLLFVDIFLFLLSDILLKFLNVPAFWHSSMNRPRAG